jgi:hypothetical protein
MALGCGSGHAGSGCDHLAEEHNNSAPIVNQPLA